MRFEWVKYYKRQGYNVIATTRNPDSATELKELLQGKEDKLFQLDVTDEVSIHRVNEQIAEAPDITIYNAGVKGYTKLPDTKITLLNAALTSGEFSSRKAGRELAFQVNAHGFDQIMYSLKDKLLIKPHATVVYVSTGVAETSQNTSGGYPFYRQSKAAGESFAREWDIDLSQNCTLESRSRIFSIVPGLVNTGMGAGIEGAANPDLRIAEMAKVIEQVRITGDTHGVWKYDGTKIMAYQIPEAMKIALPPTNTIADLLAKEGIYKLNASPSTQDVEKISGITLRAVAFDFPQNRVF